MAGGGIVHLGLEVFHDRRLNGTDPMEEERRIQKMLSDLRIQILVVCGELPLRDSWQ